MTTAASRPAVRGPGMRRGVGGGLLALARAVGFVGPLLAGAALLAAVAGPPALTALGLGRLIGNLVSHGIGTGNDTPRDLLAALIGVGCCRFVLPAALLAIRRLAMLTRHLSARWCGVPVASAYAPRPAGPGRLGYQQRMSWLLGDEGTWRDLAWLAVNAAAGPVLLLVPATLAGTGVVAFLIPALGSLAPFSGLQRLVPPPPFPGNTPLVLAIIGLAFAALGLWSGPWLLRGYGGLARLVLAPSGQAELELRVRHLAQTRRETLDTGAAELRRIERDLHDGAQARLVAMGLTLDAAGRLIDTDPAAARALLIEARDASAKALAELRDLVRGIHPPVLADRGLADALRALALDSPLRVRVTGSLDGRPPAPVESAAYFAVSELLANVAKHAGAHAAEVDMRHSSGNLRISVSDDGAGGADPRRGTGLRGVERRLAAFDGVLAVSSPAGGPTVVTMEVPCALS
ncbi:MAG TPA: histidine kinase [Trebonia sp.]|jgi:signal transduction histidine kinase|nr:histidine kinase [Trebonia sp.]